MLEKAQKHQDQIVAWRRDFHMYPELGFKETRTAGIVADELRKMGIKVQTEVGITGVVGTLGEGSPVVGIRADMDALPIQEENNVPYASQTPNVMHACGHDAHVAILLGVAKMLSEMPDRPPGEIRFIFQPSEEEWDEELGSGAVRMIEDGALEGVDRILALHVISEIPRGQVEVVSGVFSAAADTFSGEIIGKGGHGARPHETVDPIFIFAQVVNAISGIRSRQIDPLCPSVISLGSVQGGTADNTIPDRVVFNGTIRSFDNVTRKQLFEDLEQALAVSRTFGGDYILTIEDGLPGMYNDPEVAELLGQVVVDLIGVEYLQPGKADTSADDYVYMTQLAPGAMFVLGVEPEGIPRYHHSPNFDIYEGDLHIGAAILAETTCRLLKTL